jgi:hypothetical protein
MRNRRFIVIATLAASLFLGLVALLLVLYVQDNGPGVTQANCRRIEQGMTLAEVEAILGHPAKYEDAPLSNHGDRLWGMRVVYWTANDHSTVQGVFVHDKAAQVDWFDSSGVYVDVKETLLQKLDRWLGLW